MAELQAPKDQREGAPLHCAGGAVKMAAVRHRRYSYAAGVRK
jgi:hypothetical protein